MCRQCWNIPRGQRVVALLYRHKVCAAYPCVLVGHPVLSINSCNPQRSSGRILWNVIETHAAYFCKLICAAISKLRLPQCTLKPLLTLKKRHLTCDVTCTTSIECNVCTTGWCFILYIAMCNSTSKVVHVYNLYAIVYAYAQTYRIRFNFHGVKLLQFSQISNHPRKFRPVKAHTRLYFSYLRLCNRKSKNTKNMKICKPHKFNPAKVKAYTVCAQRNKNFQQN